MTSETMSQSSNASRRCPAEAVPINAEAKLKFFKVLSGYS
jgi:hypothetical protein